MLGAHDHLHRGHARAPAVSTVVSVVYYTASKTFSGSIAGYSTQGAAIETESSSSSIAPKTSSTPAVAPPLSPTHTPTTLVTSPLPSSLTSSLSTAPTSILAATSSPTLPSTTTHVASTNIPAASSSASASPDTSSSGMSTAGKAGLAIGILLLVGAVLAMVLFCFKRKREQAGQKVEDEKHEFAAVSQAPVNRQNSTATNATTRTQATAPRLSLRPITQFLPNLAEKRASKGNALNAGNDGWKPQANQAENKDNPFGNHAEKVENKVNPFGNHAETIDSTNAAGPGLVNSVTPAGDVVLADPLRTSPPTLKRGASRRDVNDTLDFTKAGPFMGPPSPSGTEFSISSEAGSPVQTATSVAIAAAGGPPTSAVHRVQLDFVPSMGDELGLKAGQLVRVLHEFDDGWAMCIRLDRSQQGVCPRTCLSARPVKPRPQQVPGSRSPPGVRGPGPQIRPMTPNGQAPRPMPAGPSPRPMTPNGQPGNAMVPRSLQPRPMTPTGPLPGTPTREDRPRANSTASMQFTRNSPPGPSPMNEIPQLQINGSPPSDSPISRKPVPGQAL